MREREQWRVRDGVVMTAKGEAERTVGVEGGTGDKLGMESWASQAQRQRTEPRHSLPFRERSGLDRYT